MKLFLLEETGEPTRIFWTFTAADKALTERLTYFVGLHALVTDIDKLTFSCYLNEDEVKVSIKEYEVEG